MYDGMLKYASPEKEFDIFSQKNISMKSRKPESFKLVYFEIEDEIFIKAFDFLNAQQKA